MFTMAASTRGIKANDSEYNVGERYRYSTVFNDDMVKNVKSLPGIKSDEILDGSDLENMFSCYLSTKGVWTLNLNSSFYAINLPEEVFSHIILNTDMHWPTISWNIYGTTRLAWLLMKLNNIKDATIFTKVPAGSAVKYLDRGEYVNKILEAIRENEV